MSPTMKQGQTPGTSDGSSSGRRVGDVYVAMFVATLLAVVVVVTVWLLIIRRPAPVIAPPQPTLNELLQRESEKRGFQTPGQKPEVQQPSADAKSDAMSPE